jgi:octaprenyl-diphosphate synthase
MMLAQTAAMIREPIAAEMEATEVVLQEFFSDESEAVSEMGLQATKYSGKRLRPMLVHLSGRTVGPTTDEHPKIAAIIEILHMASLMHDDVLDEADTRRKASTLNALYGNQLPILMGDLIYSRAFTMSLYMTTLDAARSLAYASEAICLGEIEQSFLRYSRDYDESRYFRVIELKTAALFGAACQLGTLYAGGNEEQVATMKSFGETLGMGFQIIDDCLDVVGDESVVGKSLGTDLETGKVTLPIIRLAQTLDDDGKEELRQLLYGPVDGRRRDLLAEKYDLTPILEGCQGEATAFLQSCVDLLGKMPDNHPRQCLNDICNFVINRTY